MVPGLIVRTHNLDGVYPATGPIESLLEAKMMGTPRHVNSPRQKPIGRPGSADLDKRVKEFAFKSIDLKGEYSRLRTAEGMVSDAVGLYCFEPDGSSSTSYRRRPGVPADLELERIVYRACTDLRAVVERARQRG